jgi:NitT/TauT family transport system substrate-binding protein
MSTHMTRRDAVLAAASLAAGTATFALPRVARAQSATTPATLRVVGPPNDGFKSIFWGVSSGIYKKYGLDVEITIVPSGAAAAAALGGGSAEVAYTNILTLVQAHDHGIPMVFIATGNILRGGKSPTLLLVAADSTIKTGKDLNGKTLGSASLRDINAMASLNWIDKTGGDSSTVKVVEVPTSAGAAFLEQHRADAVVLNEPGASLAIASGKAKLLAQPYDVMAGGMTAGMAAMEPYVIANRDVMTRFAKATHESATYTNAHQAETVKMVALYSGVDPDVIAKGARFTDADYLEPRYLQPLIDACAKYNLISKSFPAKDIISSAAIPPPTVSR